jgi:hypothetical protein
VVKDQEADQRRKEETKEKLRKPSSSCAKPARRALQAVYDSKLVNAVKSKKVEEKRKGPLQAQTFRAFRSGYVR